MNLSANYNVGLRKLFGPRAPKIETIFRGPSVFAFANLFKLASSLHTALGLKNLLERAARAEPSYLFVCGKELAAHYRSGELLGVLQSLNPLLCG